MSASTNLRAVAPARSQETSPDQPLTHRILARAAGAGTVAPGDVAWIDVDRAMIHDAGGPRRLGPELEALGAEVWDRGRLILVSDHYAPGSDADGAQILALTRRWAQAEQPGVFHDMEGISHTLIMEEGYAQPGMLIAGGDSHTPTAGAMGALALGFGATDMLSVLATGRTWFEVPEVLGVDLSGELPRAVSAKDVCLALLRDHDSEEAHGRVLEIFGTGVAAMSLPERSVLTNMSAEIGAVSALMLPDESVLAHLRSRDVTPDPGYERSGRLPAPDWTLDVGEVPPLLARPHSVRDVIPVTDDEAAVTRAYIGACTGAKYSDLAMAAEILRGRKVAPHIILHVAPASQRTLQEATASGVLSTLVAAGARILPSGCGACPGMGNGLLADDDVCISTTNRNFRGRMGSVDARIYLGSPYTVAASAVAGHLVDPREFATFGRGEVSA